MVRLKPLCPDRTSSESCPLGAHCRLRHRAEAGEDDESDVPQHDQVLVDANRAANGFTGGRPAPGNGKGNRRCFHYWNTGSCRDGAKCRFDHEANPNARPRIKTSSIELSSDEKIPTPFPSIDCLDNVSSDQLLVPFATNMRLKTLQQVEKFISSAKRNKSIKDVIQAEEFLLAITSSSRQNDRWDDSHRTTLLRVIAEDTNVLLLLKEVLHWPKVTSSGAQSDRLSFQSGWMALIGYLTSSSVIWTPASSHKNALYTLIETNLDVVIKTLKTNLIACVNAKSFAEPNTLNHPRQKIINVTSGLQVFGPVITLFLQYMDTFRSACTSHPELATFIPELEHIFNVWVDNIGPKDQLLTIPTKNKDFLLNKLKTRMGLLTAAAGRFLKVRIEPERQENTGKVVPTPDGRLAALERSYNGPGEYSEDGEPRHDNDEAEIQDIEIAPTEEELLCTQAPYLPTCIPGAPHHHPAESMARKYDEQFRWMRHDTFTSLRVGIQLIVDELNLPSREYQRSQISQLIKRGGGRYVSRAENDQISLPIITSVAITEIETDHNHGVIVNVQGDTPPGPARRGNIHQCKEFWTNSKRLSSGGLVAMITKEPGQEIDIALGLLTTDAKMIKVSSFNGVSKTAFGIHFIEPHSTLDAVDVIRTRSEDTNTIRVLVESGVLYTSVEAFLKALKAVDVNTVPLAKYIKQGAAQTGEEHTIDLPYYAKKPGFNWNLKTLLRPNANIGGLFMNPRSATSIRLARETLHEHGKLDPSQSDATIDCLTREMALVQGPPGTGKTFTGVELPRVILDNKVGNVLMLAFTNHALDHILRSALDSGVTKSMARLGSQSKDEVVAGYTLKMLQQVQPKKNQAVGRAFWAMKQAEEELDELLESICKKATTDEHIMGYLEAVYPSLGHHLESPPDWTRLVLVHTLQREWTTVKQDRRRRPDSVWSFWRAGLDLKHLAALALDPIVLPSTIVPTALAAAPNRFGALGQEEETNSEGGDTEITCVAASSRSDDEVWGFALAGRNHQFTPPSPHGSDSGDDDTEVDPSDDDTPATPLSPWQIDEQCLEDRPSFLRRFRMEELPAIPTRDRSVKELLGDGNAWQFSLKERTKVAEYLERHAKHDLDETLSAEFGRLTAKYDERRQALSEVGDNDRITLLRKIELLGATTNVAARLPAVLKGFAPKVLVIEEAGQVLEAHILATLFPSIEHVIAIGDPQQLRPSISCHELSAEHPIGKDMYRFDISLMERLSSGGLPMSQLQVQRRMRPEISSLIRNTLYPSLQDHDLVKQYPNVQGMSKNVFWFHHTNRESGGDDGTTKSNDFEVKMGCELVMHLLKQGIYNKEGDIVILCAYVGQVARFKAALKDKVTVLIDERDEKNLAKMGIDVGDDAADQPRQVPLTQQVLLRSIDNFQGEEAKIVILSLVRNCGDPEEQAHPPRTTIGFLKATNRVNVGLSRAKHGMYILGNKDQSASKSPMWAQIVGDLGEQNSIGPGWPIGCHQHKEHQYLADRPGVIGLKSPEGGCQERCGRSIDKCGHPCTYACHPGDPEHRLLACHQKCTRLHDPCGHPCERECWEDCGPCNIIQRDVELPCGHKAEVPCRGTLSLPLVQCKEMVEKKLETCEHTALVTCSTLASSIRCEKPCGVARDCCGKSCNKKCGNCQNLNKSVDEIARVVSRTNDDGQLAPENKKKIEIIERVKHVIHKCDKVLDTCGHSCPGDCAKDHVHEQCRAACTSECEHMRCNKRCRDSCTLCQQDCVWRCEHQECRMPCCMPCDRLPCDEMCQNLLPCGHACPSVCGEPCEAQICPFCATPNQMLDVVDLYLYQTLEQVMETEPLTRFITLACGHLFTVETLDGHVHMGDFYDQQDTGEWIRIKEAKPGFTKRPTCPTCRGPVDSRRYQRITKRALIDIQEQHALENTSGEIRRLRQLVSAIQPDRLASEGQVLASEVSHSKEYPQPDPRLTHAFNLAPTETRCIDPKMFADDIDTWFGITGQAALSWVQTVGPIMALYTKITKIVNTGRLPHVKAYEAAITKVYHEEIAIAERSNTTRDPGPSALISAKRRVGAPFPRGESRLKIEALLETIKLRLKLVPVVKSFCDELRLEITNDHYRNLNRAGQRQVINRDTLTGNFWRLAWALLSSCRRDILLALRLCRDAEARRSELTTIVLSLQVDFDFFRFGALGAITGPPLADREAREQIARVNMMNREASAQSAFTAYHDVLGFMANNQATLDWANQKILPTINQILAEWSQFATMNRLGGTFQLHVSLEEKMSIVQAMVNANYGVGGRFYQCPNGHPYVIGECGQAMEVQTCFECGVPIGGNNHNLREDNSRDMELEELATRTGAGRNPHANI